MTSSGRKSPRAAAASPSESAPSAGRRRSASPGSPRTKALAASAPSKAGELKSKPSAPSKDYAALLLQALSYVSFTCWLGSVAYGLYESGSLEAFFATLASCPLFGGAVPPPRPVPLWAYGMGHVVPGIGMQILGTFICLVVFPSERKVTRDDWHALWMSCFALGGSALLLAPMHRAIIEGRVGFMYTDVAQHGWAWVGLTFFVQLFVTESWFYWVHRLMHTPWLYKHVHRAHHQFNPSFAASASSFHPLDITCLTIGGFVTPLLMPTHRGLHGIFLFSNLVNTIAAHAASRARWSFGFFNDANLHNIHHDYGREPRNCGSLLCIWDRLAGTYEPEVPVWVRKQQALRE